MTTETQLRCPRCDSPAPGLHPAMQEGGEVQPCPDPWHNSARGSLTVGGRHWKTLYDPNDGEPIGVVCSCEIGEDHDGDGNPNGI